MKNLKEIKETLKKGKVKFNIKGYTNYQKLENGEYGNGPTVFHMGTEGDSIYNGFQGMNVEKWGSKRVLLYTYDMLKKKTTGYVYYKDIKILK